MPNSNQLKTSSDTQDQRVRQQLSGPDARKLGLQASKKGITISTLVDELPDSLIMPPIRTTGRRRLNIFSERSRILENSEAPSIQEKREHIINTFRIWESEYGKKVISDNYPIEQSLISSLVARKNKQPDWTVLRAAEYADILKGSRFPETKIYRISHQAQREPFVSEVYQFWKFLNIYLEQTSPVFRGPKPNSEIYFKTALSALITRHHLLPKGGNYRVKISPRYVSQIWYVIFGEFKSHDNIKKVLPRIIDICEKFPQWSPGYNWAEPKLFASLGKTLTHQFKM